MRVCVLMEAFQLRGVTSQWTRFDHCPRTAPDVMDAARERSWRQTTPPAIIATAAAFGVPQSRSEK
jgi:hypothetical protein